MKIERTCPRCRAWRYHPYSRDDKKRARIEVWCAECGHRWAGRLSPVERADDDAPMPPVGIHRAANARVAQRRNAKHWCMRCRTRHLLTTPHDAARTEGK